MSDDNGKTAEQKESKLIRNPDGSISIPMHYTIGGPTSNAQLVLQSAVVTFLGATLGQTIGNFGKDNPVELINTQAQEAQDAGIAKALEIAKENGITIDADTAQRMFKGYNEGVVATVDARTKEYVEHRDAHSTEGRDAGIGAAVGLVTALLLARASKKADKTLAVALSHAEKVDAARAEADSPDVNTRG